jgi:2,3-bisphosphoglycerate-independent phosphoglycerate mutase
MKHPKPITLIILDGWGYSPDHNFNAIAEADIPHWNAWWQNAPHTLLEASGNSVGLPAGQMGNSEVGHMHIGAGRVIDQDLTLIDKAIENGEFFHNPVLVAACAKARETQQAVHVLGLVSDGGVHSHINHVSAFVTLCQQQNVPEVYVHAFLDGRDTPPRSALTSLEQLDKQLQDAKLGRIASVIGRYYAMDRDKRWERTQIAYELLTEGRGDFHFESVSEAITAAYARDEGDEFVKPTLIGPDPEPIKDGDVVVFMNFRADRARQLSHALLDTEFKGFERYLKIHIADFVTLTDYSDASLATTIAFPAQNLSESLGEVVAERGLKQLRIAESEKYAHVSYFFNCGREQPFPGEDRVLVPSPKVATYDLQPEMSSDELTTRIVAAISSEQYDFMVVNFACPDMLGHTGNLPATIQSITHLDRCLAQIAEASAQVGGEIIFTADHGNAECMQDPVTHQPHTAHTTNQVPFIYLGRPATVRTGPASLIDIAPTILYALGLPIPKEMTGHSLLSFEENKE